MKKLIIPLCLFGMATLSFGAATFKQSSEAVAGDEAPPEPADPKKKKPGDVCQTSDECQKHHRCKKDGDKGICTEPPRPRLPPGAVT